MSTAMIGEAPASADPATAATPTPPQPITATDLPRVTPPVLIAAPMPAITPQPSSPTAAGRADGSTLVHWPAATRVFSAKAPMPSAGESSVPLGLERHLLGRVEGREAVPRLAAVAGPAVAADRAPVEHHEVARLEPGHVRPDRLDHAGGLVAQQEREVVVDPALAVVQVGVADPAGLHLHHRLARPRVRHVDRDQLDRRALGPRDHGLDLLHGFRLSPPAWHCSGPANRMARGGHRGMTTIASARCVLGVCEDDHDGADDGGRSGDDGSADD